jgi:hypothetical protein
MSADHRTTDDAWPRRVTLTRRRFLVLAASCIATAVASACGDDDDDRQTSTAGSSPSIGAGGSPSPGGTVLSLDQFMQLSKVLTGFNDLNDTASGRLYLDALVAQPEKAERLVELWTTGGFDSATPPTSVADLEARGVFGDEALAELADMITANWYTGTYTTADGELRVATYTNALAWRALGYRQTGPSTCGGAFGHWAIQPAP